MEKIFKVAQIRDLLNQVHNEKISFSRMVEIMNEEINNEINKQIEKHVNGKNDRMSASSTSMDG